MSGFTQLRVEVPDHPGALAAVTRVLARHGMNVVEVSIHEVDGAHAVDEIVVQSDGAISHLPLRHDLAHAGADLLSIVACTAPPDLVVAALTWVCTALDKPSSRSTFSAGIAVLTGISPLRVVSSAEAERHPIGLAAMRRGAPVVQKLAEVPGALGTDGGSGARWVLAAPDGRDADLVVMAARPHAVRFTATELRRLAAALDCRRRMLAGTATAGARAAWTAAVTSNA